MYAVHGDLPWSALWASALLTTGMHVAGGRGGGVGVVPLEGGVVLVEEHLEAEFDGLRPKRRYMSLRFFCDSREREKRK